MLPQYFGLLGGALLVIILLSMAIQIINEYERGVTFRLGRLIGTKGPGLIVIIPIIDRLVRVTLRTVVYDVPVQEVITRDNVTCKVNAVLYYRVVAPEKAVVNVQRYHEATIQLAQTTLRSVVGEADLDELLSEREKLNQKLQKIIDEATDPWGIKVTTVEIKDVMIPEAMQRTIARQAEAERRKRAVIIQADGERQAAVQLARAADILSKQEGGLTLRTLRTASEISAEKSSSIFFPLPMEFGGLLSRIDLDELINKSSARESSEQDHNLENESLNEEHHDEKKQEENDNE
ncbi:slipin family protein [Natranaerobius thermophilus]|uniref:SPFH domain, Band 7 family protein n=1 Tax=Natranaerobius thermophilus (strain ATCC BAA-1301 / DSM 18059 / JW/NM-WN-LF) TaxID=457570 RepID=B2A5G0_NATTJ|nr:slipin family protein [Natranaerobius thermophilus]ACB85315.1 SPFH domain, Band 7 family protein [Natranaerobius thermophilus JW/NM-WN-LF]